MSRIGVPLVWRYRKIPESGRVLIQYKHSLREMGTFVKDEWGPWVKKTVSRNNPSTGVVEEVK
eukprot:1305569-Pleurochrysis_carterae.AAC.1